MPEIEVERIDRDRDFYPEAPFWECTIVLRGFMQAPSDKRAGELFLEHLEEGEISGFYSGKMNVERKDPSEPDEK